MRNPNSSYHIDRLAWIMVLGSLLLVLGLGFVVVRLSLHWYQRVAASEVVSAALQGDFAASERSLEKLVSGPPVVSRVLALFGSDDAPQFAPVARELLVITRDLSESNIATQFERFDKLERETRLRSLFDLEDESLAASVQELLSRGRMLTDKLSIEQQNMVRIERDLAQSRNHYELLTKDVTDLFNLPAVYESSTGGGSGAEGMPFYREGVLAGIPSLQKLPDSLPDLATLKAALDEAGGAVQIEGTDVHTEFARRLGELTVNGRSIAEELRSLGALKESGQRAIGELSIEISRLTKQSRAALLKLLTAILAPEDDNESTTAVANGSIAAANSTTVSDKPQ